MNEKLRLRLLIIRSRLTFAAARNYLTRNKIFFDTIIAISLSIIVIFLSIGAYQTSNYQAQLMEKEHLPIFKINIKPVYNETSLKEDNITDYLEIENVGEQISEVFIRDLVIIKINSKQPDSTLYAPVRNYYYIIPDKDNKNRWYSIGEEGNAYTISEMIKELSKILKSRYQDVKITFDRYLKISYRDRMGLQHSDYFYIYPDGGSKLLSFDDGTKIEEIYNSNLDQLIVLPIPYQQNTSSSLNFNWVS